MIQIIYKLKNGHLFMDNNGVNSFLILPIIVPIGGLSD